MKKIIFISILLGICCLLLSPIAVSAKTIKLTLASQNPETSWGHTSAIMPWVEQVEKATNGKVKIQVYASQTLTKGKDTWEATKAGIADIGWCFHGYWRRW